MIGLKDILFYAVLIALAYYVITRLLKVREGFESTGSEPGFCFNTAAVENCRCDDFHPCGSGFTCQKGVCRVPCMPEL